MAIDIGGGVRAGEQIVRYVPAEPYVLGHALTSREPSQLVQLLSLSHHNELRVDVTSRERERADHVVDMFLGIEAADAQECRALAKLVASAEAGAADLRREHGRVDAARDRQPRSLAGPSSPPSPRTRRTTIAGTT